MKKRSMTSATNPQELLDDAISYETDATNVTKPKRSSRKKTTITSKKASDSSFSENSNGAIANENVSNCGMDADSSSSRKVSEKRRRDAKSISKKKPERVVERELSPAPQKVQRKRVRGTEKVKVTSQTSVGTDFRASSNSCEEENDKSSVISEPSRTRVVKRKRTTKRKECKEQEQVAQDASVCSGEDAISPVDVLSEIRAKIAAVPLSDNERRRRVANEEKRKKVPMVAQERTFPFSLPFWSSGWLVVNGAREHNLQSIDAPFPISAFSVVTGVSGSGKSSLVEDVIHRYLAKSFYRTQVSNIACDSISGLEYINKVVKVDQSPIGQTPNSTAATYTGVFDLIRRLFAQLPESKLRGYSARQFSFNTQGGRCEKCEGAGCVKVEMHFLADFFVPCDLCRGKRYNADTLSIKYRGKSISDVLEMTCGEALSFFSHIPPIARILQTLNDVGLDYLPLGQSAVTLSGGEAQRVKLASELSLIESGKTLYILDEPTTGLHFEDIRKLLLVLHRLVDLGNTVIVVEHNLDVIKNADWIVEIGPEAGMAGGRLVFAGTPEQLLEYTVSRQTDPKRQKTMLRSYTGEALLPVFRRGVFFERTVLDPQQYWENVRNDARSAEELIEQTADSQLSEEKPWEIDGKRWHTEFRTTLKGKPCKWDGVVLSTIVEKLEETSLFAEVNWNKRGLVEVRSDSDSSAWFMKAETNEEWLLHLAFRAAQNTFKQSELVEKLALRPLKDMDEIPLFGTLPRVKVTEVGNWQQIDIKVFSFKEIDNDNFWSFLDAATKSFDAAMKSSLGGQDEDLTPWKTQGILWHTSSSLGFYGNGDNPAWSKTILTEIIALIERLPYKTFFQWDDKIVAPFFIKGKKTCWGKIYTKKREALSVQINYPKGAMSLERFKLTDVEYEINNDEPTFDSLYLRYKDEERFDVQELNRLLLDAAELFVQSEIA